jgi:ATP-dependent protease HslVU (ClpYQ) peptidase subunit
MTTIIGVQGDGFVLLCSDSRITDVDEKGHATQAVALRDAGSKIAQNGRWILGAAGDLRAINILHYVFQPPTPTPSTRGRKLDEFVSTKFIPALRECFEAQGYATPSTDDRQHIAEHASIVMVAVNATIYVIDGDYSWMSDSQGVYALGSGAQFALGALATQIPSKAKLTIPKAKSAVLKAIGIASRYDPHTGPPYQTVLQETRKGVATARKTVRAPARRR